MYIYATYYDKQKTFWEFRVFSAPLCKCSIFLLFCFFAFILILDKLQKTKTETKKRDFRHFCLKTSDFVANKTLFFSGLQVYRANCTPPPPFLALAGWVSSRPNFFIFYFFIFVNYSDFQLSAFLLNFEHFLKHHIYFFFCIKFHNIYFWLFLCVR